MELDCGIRQSRITSWLSDELCLPQSEGGWSFSTEEGACRISATPLENRAIGKLDLERTLVAVEGDDGAVSEFYRLFTLRFISAGG